MPELINGGSAKASLLGGAADPHEFIAEHPADGRPLRAALTESASS